MFGATLLMYRPKHGALSKKHALDVKYDQIILLGLKKIISTMLAMTMFTSLYYFKQRTTLLQCFRSSLMPQTWCDIYILETLINFLHYFKKKHFFINTKWYICNLVIVEICFYLYICTKKNFM